VVHGLDTLVAINNMLAQQEQPEPQQKEPVRLDINKRVELSLAVSRYLRSVEKFENASDEFNKSCQHLRACLNRAEHRFIAKVDFQHYLVTSNSAGDFDVQKVDSL
jgi:hypothetical protein